MIEKNYIEVQPFTFIFSLIVFALLVWYSLDWFQSIIVAGMLLLYGYSISYGSKTYKEYCELKRKRHKK